MKKYISMVLILFVLIACNGCGKTQNDSSNDNGVYQSTATYTRDFNSETNTTVTFGVISFQMPKEWSVIERTDTALQIQGKDRSIAGPIWVEHLSNDISEEELSSKQCQNAVLDAYKKMLLESCDTLEITHTTYYPEDGLFFSNIDWSVDERSATLGICALVEQNNLYVFLVPFVEGDKYNYSLDVSDAIYSITAANSENLSKEEDDTDILDSNSSDSSKDDSITINELATQKIQQAYMLGFGDVSWYSDIVSIEAYMDNSCTVKIKDNAKEDGQFYAALIWGIANDEGIKEVRAINSKGELLFVFIK